MRPVLRSGRARRRRQLVGDTEKLADKAEVFQGEDDKWYVRTKSAGNDEIILRSDGYENQAHALRVATDTGLPVEIVDSFLREEDDNA